MEKRKVLIADDEMDMRIFLKTLLETSGYQPFITRDGREGLQKAREVIPDLIILDVMMPGEGGPQTYRRLKSDQELAHIPVIMLSGVKKDSFFHYLKMLNAGGGGGIPLPAAYFEKPVKHEDLIKAIRSILDPVA
jgi:two-component system, OmpR family, phosphate regulon response regulator PhoB